MNSEPDEPALFDLPMAPPGVPDEASEPELDAAPRRSRSRAARPASLPLFDVESSVPDRREEPAPRAPRPSFDAMPRAASGPQRLESVAAAEPRPAENVDGVGEVTPAALGPRLRAGFGDLTVLAAVGSVAAFGARMLGGSLALRDLPAFAAFLLAFSFLYCVVSLAFWGQTPGMAWSGIVARTDVTEPLSFGQTAMRWLGHWLTWALLGLPALLAVVGEGGRSLADRMSSSATYVLPSRG